MLEGKQVNECCIWETKILEYNRCMKMEYRLQIQISICDAEEGFLQRGSVVHLCTTNMDLTEQTT